MGGTTLVSRQPLRLALASASLTERVLGVISSTIVAGPEKELATCVDYGGRHDGKHFRALYDPFESAERRRASGSRIARGGEDCAYS